MRAAIQFLLFISLCLLNRPAPLLAATATDIKIITNRNETEKTLWQTWKSKYSVNTAKGTLIKDNYHNMVLSEGMCHAMLLAVQFNDQKFFDSILSGLDNFFLNKNGLYCWKLQPNGERYEDPNTWITATESETNILFALLQAQKLQESGLWISQKYNYKQRAQALEKLIIQHETIQQEDKILLLPSDGKDNPYWPVIHNFGTDNEPKIAWNPSYMNPAFFKVFHKQFPESGWNIINNTAMDLIEHILKNSHDLLKNDFNIKGINPVPAWVYIVIHNGTTSVDNYFLGATYEGSQLSNEYDAVRVPLYIGLDYIWDKNERSRKVLETFARLSNVDNPRQAFCGADKNTSRGYNTPFAVGAFGIANMAVNNDKEFTAALTRSIRPDKTTFGKHNDYYYHQTFCLYSLLALNRRFVKITD